MPASEAFFTSLIEGLANQVKEKKREINLKMD